MQKDSKRFKRIPEELKIYREALKDSKKIPKESKRFKKNQKDSNRNLRELLLAGNLIQKANVCKPPTPPPEESKI